jgi:hypothetical protein
MATNYRQIMAIRKANEDKIQRLCPEATENSGIYVFWRVDANEFKYAYVGQAKNLLKRLAEHLSGYQHIDCSIKKYKFYDEESNPYGYHVNVIEECDEEDMDERERYWIKEFADKGYQLRNATTGSQGSGKAALGDGKSTKGYREGLSRGYDNARRDVAKWFEKNLTYSINGKDGKLKQRAYEKFTEFLNVNGSGEEEDEI